MPEFELQETRGQSFNGPGPCDRTTPISVVATVHDVADVDPRFRDTRARNAAIDGYRQELADYRAAACLYHDEDPATVFATISSHYARVAQIRSDLQYQAGREANEFRTKQVDPFLNELKAQFEFISRKFTTMEAEMRMAGIRST